MPGTHCKWVRVADGAVAGFTTWLTGELFSVLSQHSILRHALGPQPSKVSHDDPVFERWLDDGLAHPGDALSRLFRIRASTLLFDMQPQQAAAALSGLLIGSEVASARAAFGMARQDDPGRVGRARRTLRAGARPRRLCGNARRCRHGGAQRPAGSGAREFRARR